MKNTAFRARQCIFVTVSAIHDNENCKAMPVTHAVPQAPEIGQDFFKALSKVRSIHTNCKVLLRTHHQRAGLEIMDAMSAHQEAAYERLCRSTFVMLPFMLYSALNRGLQFRNSLLLVVIFHAANGFTCHLKKAILKDKSSLQIVHRCFAYIGRAPSLRSLAARNYVHSPCA